MVPPVCFIPSYRLFIPLAFVSYPNELFSYLVQHFHTRELRNVAGHLARNGGFEPITAPQESSSGNSQNVSKGGDLSDEKKEGLES